MSADAEVTYPREVPVMLGMPSGWIGVEKQFGAGAKNAGATYVRWNCIRPDPPAKSVSVGSPKQVIQIDAEALKYDWEPVYQEFLRLQNEQKEQIQAEREAAGTSVIKGQKRDDYIAVFKSKFSPLTGPVVMAFPGWTTQWCYTESSNQTFIIYIEPSGKEWRLLVDLEAYMGLKMQNGQEALVGELVAFGQANADADAFGMGAKKARELGGKPYQVVPPLTGKKLALTEENAAVMNKTLTLQERRGGLACDSAEALSAEAQTRKQLRMEEEAEAQTRKRLRMEEDAASEKNSADSYKDQLLSVVDVAGSTAAALANLVDTKRDDILQSAQRIHSRLVKRCFKENTELLAVIDGADDPREDPCLGFFYNMGSDFTHDGRPMYQAVEDADWIDHGLQCLGRYIFWNDSASRWQIGPSPEEDRPCWAYYNEERLHPGEIATPVQVRRLWQVSVSFGG